MEPNLLRQPEWRIEVYTIRADGSPYPGYLADFSTFYTTELSIQKERNYPDEVHFTLDLQQLQEKAAAIGVSSANILAPYKHLVKIYRNNVYITQAIVEKTTVNLNNDSKNTVEVSCVDWLGILDKRLIHQDYGEGSWADFANLVLMDAQHEPNRIYNYAFEGDGTGIDNAWFRGWKYHVPADMGYDFTEWEPGVTYQMFAHVSYKGKFWESNKTHISEDTFSESNWEEIGWTDDDREETFTPVYAVWREDDEEEGPTGTKYGGWGGTSSCHMTAKTYSFNTPFQGSINLAGSAVSTTLVAPIPQFDADDDIVVPKGYTRLKEVAMYNGQYIDTGLEILDTMTTETRFQMVGELMEEDVGYYPLVACNYGEDYETEYSAFGVSVAIDDGAVYSPFSDNMAVHYDPDDSSIMTIKSDFAAPLTTPLGASLLLGIGRIKYSYLVPPEFDYIYGDYSRMRNCPVKFFSHKVWDENGNLVQCLVPASRDSDGATGMVDTITKIFHTSVTGADFEPSVISGPGFGETYTRVMAREILDSQALSSLPSEYAPLGGIDMSEASPIVLMQAEMSIYGQDYDTTFGNCEAYLDATFPEISSGERADFTIMDNSFYGGSYNGASMTNIGDGDGYTVWTNYHYKQRMTYTDCGFANGNHKMSCIIRSGYSRVIVDGTQILNDTTQSTWARETSESVLFGGSFPDGAEMVIHSFILYDYTTTSGTAKNENIHLHPCVRRADGVVGFYESVKGRFIHTEGMKAGGGTASFRTFVEGVNGQKTYSPTFELTESGWNDVSYVYPVQDFDIYRFGIQILSGDILFDTPLVYKNPVDGDEWDLGLRPGSFPTETEQEDAKWTHDRFTPTFEWKKAKEALQDLSNMDSDNFWFEIDRSKRMNISLHGGGKDVAIELSYPKNITNMTVSSNAADIVNYIKGDGSSEVKQDPLVSGIKNDNGAPFTWIGFNKASMLEYWPLAAAESFNSERTITTLRQDIDAKISTYSTVLDVPEIVVENNTIDVGTVNIGDTVSVSALNNPYVQKVNGLYKIEAMKVNVDVDGREKVSLTLIRPSVTQLNALTFPQMVKVIMNRRNY